MNHRMRVPILLVCTSLFLNTAHAEILSDADRETLLGNLEKLKEAADSKVDARFRLALAAYRSAMASDDAAIELYINCMDKVKFEDQKKKPAEFREWKRKESEKLSDPSLRLALRHQLHWLILTLQATSEKADRAKLANEAQEAVDAIFRDYAKLKSQEPLLSQAVTASVFARAYEIETVKVQNWPLSPIQLGQVYEQILLPPFRTPARLAELRVGWIKRIQQEGAKVEGEAGGRRDDRKIATPLETSSADYDRFLTETQPKLQWEMEMDLFRNGDESGAAVRMLAHLEKHITHPSAREWGDQFKALLKPSVPATAAKSAAAAP